MSYEITIDFQLKQDFSPNREQSGQGLHYLPFHHYLSHSSCCCKMDFLTFYDMFGEEKSCPNIKGTVKPVLSGHSKRRPKLVFKTDNHLMQVKSIAECSKGSILQYF